MKQQGEKLRIAIVYDKAVTWGGAEQVVLALRELYPEAVLVTPLVDKRTANWVNEFVEIQTSWMNRLPVKARLLPFLTPLMPEVFDGFDLSSYDIVISVTSYDGKGVMTRADQLHLSYILTPNRWCWVETGVAYGGFGWLSGLAEWWQGLIAPGYRQWDQLAATRPDAIAGISGLVQSRIAKYYDRESRVIYPTVQGDGVAQSVQRGSYFLCVGRLVDYKRFDLVIGACRTLGLPLKIAGTGPLLKRYQQMTKADDHIEVLGFVEDSALRTLIAEARALVMPQIEDFGITAMEAWAVGTPVLLHAESGVAELMTEGRQGVLIHEQTVNGVMEAINIFEHAKLKAKDCQKLAKMHSRVTFLSEFEAWVSDEWNKLVANQSRVL